MIQLPVSISAIFAFVALTGVAAAQQIGVDDKCTCRAPGRNVAFGKTACLQTPDGFRIATCRAVLNNTSWEFSKISCVGASLSKPAPTKAHHAAIAR